MIYDIAIVGAGASGLMLASTMQNRNICIIDSNDRVGAKLRVSGGGKCNITNSYLDISKYNNNHRIVKHTFKNFNNAHTLDFLDKNKVPVSLHERLVKGAYFLNTSKDIVNVLKKLTSKSTFFLNTKVLDVDMDNDIFHIKTSKQIIQAKQLVVASGGLSYPVIGASGIGYEIAKKFGHTVSSLSPALVGWSVQKEQFWFKELSGLSIRGVKITIGDKTTIGDFLFTHRGCSGPSVLSASLHWSKGLVYIDFLATDQVLPKRFYKLFKEHSSQDIRNYSFAPAGTFGYTKAEVTKGGVVLSELTPKLESKYQKNLYFIGEVLDATGELGGYNIQWAFSSALKII